MADLGHVTPIETKRGPALAKVAASEDFTEAAATETAKTATASSVRYEAFISYSHGATGEMARAMQRFLQSYAKPWWRRRSMDVFRDETDLSANPALWESIVAALSVSDWL